MNEVKKNSILIIGGGLIGLSIAYEFAKNNFQVEVLSKNRSEAAGFVAAGMLATHAEGLENELLNFGIYSQNLIPDWINNIQADSGINCGLKQCGIIVPFEKLEDLKKFPTFAKGQYLNQSDINSEIKGLNTKWQHGLLFEQDGQIDNRRRLMRALERACSIHNVKFQEGAEIKELIFDKNVLKGVKIITATGDLKSIFCEKAVLCCGAWSNQIFNKAPVFPIKGQMLSIQGPKDRLKRIIFGPKTYLVPREDGLIIVGATVERAARFENGNTPKGIKELQTGIYSLFPEAANWPHMEHWWGFRPATPDLKPIIGKSPLKNLFLATGHYRNGVLFSAATSNLIYKLINELELSTAEKQFLTEFKLERF